MSTQEITQSKEIEALELATLDAIFNGDTVKVTTLFGKAERLFIKGNKYTRSLIANKFIFPLTTLLEMNYSWGRDYLILFPQQLKAEYCRQFNAFGI